jgi:hypothetical protein
MTQCSIQASKLLENLRAIRLQIEAEIQKQQRCQSSILRGGQGTLILNQVQVMEQQIESSALPPPEQRVRGIGSMVVDSWPTDSQLGAQILAVEQAYLKLKEHS